MKQCFAWSIILLMFWSAIRPAWPLVEYVVQHEYIAEVLCINKDQPELQCDGKCYLRAQLAQTVLPAEEDTPALPQIEWEVRQLFFTDQFLLNTFGAHHAPSVAWPKSIAILASQPHAPPTPPPQV